MLIVEQKYLLFQRHLRLQEYSLPEVVDLLIWLKEHLHGARTIHVEDVDNSLAKNESNLLEEPIK